MWLLVWVCAACSDGAPKPATVPHATAADAAAGCAQFTREGLKLKAKSRAGLQAEAGSPAKTAIQVEPNRHLPAAQDSIFRLQYDGMTVQLRKPGPGGELLERVTVSKRKWLTYPYFQPGVSAANVIAVLGEPQRRDGDWLIYTCGGGEAEAPVVFETKDGTVQRIVFNYYVD